MIDLIYLMFMLLHSVHHTAVVRNYFIKEVYEIDKPAPKYTGCCKKKNREVTPVQTESEVEHQNLYNKAKDRLKKDLDIVQILQELNTIKYFLITNLGMPTSTDLSRTKTLKGLDGFDLKQREDRETSKNAQAASDQHLHRQSSKIHQAAIIKKESGDTVFSKPMPVSSTYGVGFKQQPVGKKKSLFSSSKKIWFEPVGKASQQPGDFDPQALAPQKNSFDGSEN